MKDVNIEGTDVFGWPGKGRTTFLWASLSLWLLCAGCARPPFSRSIVGEYVGEPTITRRADLAKKEKMSISRDGSLQLLGFAGTISDLNGARSTVLFMADNRFFDFYEVPKSQDGRYSFQVQRLSKDRFIMTGGPRLIFAFRRLSTY